MADLVSVVKIKKIVVVNQADYYFISKIATVVKMSKKNNLEHLSIVPVVEIRMLKVQSVPVVILLII